MKKILIVSLMLAAGNIFAAELSQHSQLANVMDGAKFNGAITPAVKNIGINAAVKTDILSAAQPSTVIPEEKGLCSGIDREKVFNTWAYLGGIAGIVAGALVAHTWWVGALAGFGIVGVGGILLILIGTSIFYPSFYK